MPRNFENNDLHDVVHDEATLAAIIMPMLKDICHSKVLPRGGNKQVLIDRILEDQIRPSSTVALVEVIGLYA